MRSKSTVRWGLILVLITVLVRGTALRGQEIPEHPVLRQALAEVDLGDTIAVAAGTDRVDGILRAFSGTRFTIASDNTEIVLRVARIDSLWVRGTAMRTGSMVGIGVGLALTTLSCAQVLDECGLDVGLLVITPALALLGAGVGSTIRNWRRLYP